MRFDSGPAVSARTVDSADITLTADPATAAESPFVISSSGKKAVQADVSHSRANVRNIAERIAGIANSSRVRGRGAEFPPPSPFVCFASAARRPSSRGTWRPTSTKNRSVPAHQQEPELR